MTTIILSLLTYKKDFEYNKFTSFLKLHAREFTYTIKRNYLNYLKQYARTHEDKGFSPVTTHVYNV